jgi:surfactin synthase thioesterase subunit
MSMRWFEPHERQPSSDALIFCFPYAGGSAAGYLDWQEDVGDVARLVAVRLPGRGPRADEPAPPDLAGLADVTAGAIMRYLDGDTHRPVVLFGHSFGALLAFETARRLDRLPGLRHLVASGCAAPSLLPSDYLRWAAGLDRRAFAEAVGAFGGVRPEILADEDLQDLLLPDLRTDVVMMARYTYRPAPPLPAGVSLVNGRADQYVEPAALEPWRRECTSTPAHHWVDGGHFYFQQRPAAVVDVLRAAVMDGSGSRLPTGEHVEVI